MLGEIPKAIRQHLLLVPEKSPPNDGGRVLFIGGEMAEILYSGSWSVFLGIYKDATASCHQLSSRFECYNRPGAFTEGKNDQEACEQPGS